MSLLEDNCDSVRGYLPDTFMQNDVAWKGALV